ncbi:MAG: hypothetical protein VB101_00870 [Rhodospirillaceae bacterium]|nr:hypothetical protein [Rhodospirillaceae bacterium]
MIRPGYAVSALIAALLIGTAGGVYWWPERSEAPGPGPEDADERAAMIESRGLAWRDGPGLHIRMDTGAVLVLTDRMQCGALPCPSPLVVQYRYRGWDKAAAGYRLAIGLGGDHWDAILPFAGDPVLIEVERAGTASSGTLPQPESPAPVSDDARLKEWLSGIAAGRDRREQAALATADGLARRDGAVLTLRLSKDESLRLTDDLACGQLACPPGIFRSFAYAGLDPGKRFHAVIERSDEMNWAFLIARADGALTPLLGPPVFSPDGRHVASAIDSLEGVESRRLEIVDLSGDAPRVAFTLSAKGVDDSIYAIEGWDGGNRLRLLKAPWGEPEKRRTVLLTAGPGGFRVQEP